MTWVPVIQTGIVLSFCHVCFECVVCHIRNQHNGIWERMLLFTRNSPDLLWITFFAGWFLERFGVYPLGVLSGLLTFSFKLSETSLILLLDMTSLPVRLIWILYIVHAELKDFSHALTNNVVVLWLCLTVHIMFVLWYTLWLSTEPFVLFVIAPPYGWL